MDPSQTVASSANEPLASTPPVNSPPQTNVETKSKGGAMEVIGSILTVVLLLFFFPLGLILMWVFTKWPKIVKIIITIFFLVIGGILAIEGLTIYNALQKNAANVHNQSSEQSLKPGGFGLSNQQQTARNEERKVDIDTMAEIFEMNYDPKLGRYQPLKGGDFAAGKVPQDPNGGAYLGLISTASAHFNVCANMENITPPQYCKTSLH